MRDEFDFEGNRRRKKIILYIVSTILEAALLVFLGFAVTHFGMQSMAISVEDMSPTLNVGDQILINKMSYHIHKPRREDVIVVKEHGSEHSYYAVVRVIGLPGETVRIDQGSVYIDGKKLKEKLDFPAIENAGLASEEIVLDDDEYFVLGDNRNQCEDSRNASVGNIRKGDILGKAWIRKKPSFTFVKMIDPNFTIEEN